MGLGNALYSNDNDGYLVPKRHRLGYFQLWGNTAAERQRMGLGVMMWEGYIPIGEAFTCPADNFRHDPALPGYTTDNTRLNPSAGVLSSYSMQPQHFFASSATVYSRAAYHFDFPVTSGTARRAPYAVITDAFDGRYNPQPHWSAPRSHSDGYNTSYTDGHASMVIAAPGLEDPVASNGAAYYDLMGVINGVGGGGGSSAYLNWDYLDKN